MPAKAVRRLAAAVLAASAAVAQYPVVPGLPPGATPLPRLTCNQPWVGRTDFEFRLDGAEGGAAGFLCLSTAPANTSVLGVPVWIDLDAVVGPPIFLTTSGAPGIPGAGSWTLPISLAPFGPAVAGAQLYAQVALDAPAANPTFVTSSGVEAAFTLTPQIFGATIAPGSAAQYAFLDGQSFTAAYPSVRQPFASNLVGAAYADGGNRLYVAAGANINVAEFTARGVVWSNFHPVQGFMAGEGAGVAYDRRRKVLWTVAIPVGGQQVEILGFDADPASPGYATLLHQTSGFGNFVGNGLAPIGPWSISPDGSQLAVLDGNPKTLHIYDLDPLSASFLQPVLSSLAPGTGGIFPTYAGAEFSRDGSTVLIIRTPIFGATEIARFSPFFGQWLDHNPLTPGIQSIGPNSLPAVTIPASCTDLSPLPNGDVLLCGSGGQGFTAKVQFGQAPAPAFSLQTASTLTPAATRISADLDGDLCVVGALQGGTTPSLFVFDVATLTLLATHALAPSSFTPSTIKTLVWR
jgi:hypothetical protein